MYAKVLSPVPSVLGICPRTPGPGHLLEPHDFKAAYNQKKQLLTHPKKYGGTHADSGGRR